MSKFERAFWRLLTEEQRAAIEELEFGFLGELGYKTSGCRLYEKRRRRLKNALKRDRARFERVIYPEQSGQGILYFYVYRKRGGPIIRSKAIRFICGGDADEGREAGAAE